MGSVIESFRAPDGLTLSRRRWRAQSPWARVLIVHGLAEHSGRYEHVGEHLAGAGLETVAPDLRGFGRSGGRRAWVGGWSELHDDLEAQILDERATRPALPVALYGHSLGGMLVLGYVLADRSAQPDALVLSAPALEADIPVWKQALAGFLGRVTPTVMIPNGLRDHDLSRDPRVTEDYRSDPLNVHASTARFGAEGLREQRRVRASLDRLSIPSLVIHGGEDTLVPTRASAALGGRPGVTRKVYDGYRHELHNEPDHERVLDDVVGWLHATFGDAAPSASSLATEGDAASAATMAETEHRLRGARQR